MKRIYTVILLLSAGTLLAACSEADSVSEAVRSNGELDTLEEALVITGLEDTLEDENTSYTLFAPNEDAFENFLAGSGVDDISEVDTDALLGVLEYHIVLSEYDETELEERSGTTLSTMRGDELSIRTVDGDVFINSAEILDPGLLDADNDTENGVVHKVDRVLTPPGF